MKQLYYKAKGWTETGMMPKELLEKLGMPDVAEAIGV
jgi:aldehyde:ferredoxin oxidoreductase